jgi:hypothetical protein
MTNKLLDGVLEPWREAHPLESPILKLGRAKKHLETIGSYETKYNSLDPNYLTRSLVDSGTVYEYRLQSQFPPFLDFGIVIGEFAYQVRSALDQLIFALSVFPSGLSGKDLHTAERASSFPILLEPNDTRLKGQIKYVPASISAAVLKIVDDVQPYQRGQMAESDALAILDEINLRDKHRLLRPAGNLIRVDKTDLAKGIEIRASNTIGDGDVFARMPVHLDPKIELEPRIKAEIKIDIERPARGVGLTVLPIIYGRVCRDILPQFEQFFATMPASVKKKSEKLLQ